MKKEDQDYKVKVCRARTREFLMTCEDDSKDFSWIGKLAKSCVDRAIEQQKRERQMIEEHKAKKEKTSLLDDLRQQSQQQSRDIVHHGRSVHSAPRTSAKGSWIVILPSGTNALITMYNAKRFFVDGVFQPSSELRSKGKEAMSYYSTPSNTPFHSIHRQSPSFNTFRLGPCSSLHRVWGGMAIQGVEVWRHTTRQPESHQRCLLLLRG